VTGDQDRERFFTRVRDDIAGYYLTDPENPYRMSGRGKGRQRWEETRRCIADAIDRPGDFMDVGCANGLLVESLLEWSDHEIVPHGIDFVPELVECAKQRLPQFAANFEVANAWHWAPERT